MTVRKLRCKRESCFHVWIPRTPNPKWCPICHYGQLEETSQLKLDFEKGMHKTPSPTEKRRYEKRKGYKMTTPPKEIITYCFRCRSKKLMKNVGHVVLKNGRRAIRGVCSSCGTKMYKIKKS